ncbi:MAG: FG-GAP repeat protein [Phycisphaerales bacterium]|nr:FG-GAP repeat protein [Phycisphaerales bacterium]
MSLFSVATLAGSVQADVEIQNLSGGEEYGAALSASDTHLAVGAPDCEVSRVYLYQRQGSSWAQSAVLQKDGGGCGFLASPRLFGAALDLDGNTLVVGAPGWGNTGAIFVYERTQPGNWDEVLAEGGSAGTRHRQGEAVAVSGDWIIAGSPIGQIIGPSEYVTFFQRVNGNWTESVSISRPSENANDFGRAVDLDGDVAVIGAVGDSTAWVLERTSGSQGSNWDAGNLVALETDEAGSPAGFGAAVAVESDLIAVTTSGSTTYLFRRGAKGWAQEARLDLPAGSNPGSASASSVAIAQDRVLVGVPEYNSSDDAGAVHAFEKVEDGWRYYGRYDTEGIPPTLGTSVATDGSHVFAGAPGENGAVMIYDACRDCDESGGCDTDEISQDPGLDCDGSGLLDSCELAEWGGADCDGDGVLDVCQLASGGYDCDGDGQIDTCAIANGEVTDCNRNSIPDSCDIAGGIVLDCDEDGLIDFCAIAQGIVPDCNENGVPDDCDLADGTVFDCNGDGVPDTCQPPTLEVVFIYDVSGSVDEGKGLCWLTTGAVDQLEDWRYIVSDLHGQIILDFYEDDWWWCTDVPDGGLAGLYGTQVPNYNGTISSADGIEDWADAAAVVADRHPWEGVYRVIVTMSDECPERGGDSNCDENDQLAIDNAVEVLNENNVSAITIVTDLNSSSMPIGLEALASQLAGQTGGVYIDDSEGTLTSGELAEILRDYAPEPSGCGTCLGDLDCNNQVDGADLTMLLATWGITSDPIGDLDEDCQVTGQDLTILLGHWGMCP